MHEDYKHSKTAATSKAVKKMKKTVKKTKMITTINSEVDEKLAYQIID